MAFEIVRGAEFLSNTCIQLAEYYPAGGLRSRKRLTLLSFLMKMKLGEHPRRFLLRVDRMVKDWNASAGL